MTDEIAALRAEVAALRAELAEQKATQQNQAITRRRLLTGLAGLGAAGAAGIANATPAAAADGDPILIGQSNDAENTTILRNGTAGDLPGDPPPSGTATLWLESELGHGLVVVSPLGVRIAAEDGLLATGWQAIVGESDGLVGVAGVGHSAVGVYAESDTSPALAVAVAEGPHILLEPPETEGPPEFHGQLVGAIRMDSNAELWLCTAVSIEGQGTWTRLLREDTTPGRVIPITPFRAIDTRDPDGRVGDNPTITGQRSGPIHGGETVTLQLRDHPDIPTTATGVFGSLAVVRPNYTGSCRVLPSDSERPASAVNFTKGVGAISNAYTSALGPDGLSLRPSGTAIHETHLILDVAGYLT